MAEGYNSLSDLLEEQHEPSFLSNSIAFNSADNPDVDGGYPSSLNAVIGEEFERSRPPSSLSRHLASMTPLAASVRTKFDFRALEYIPDYDSRLMCPICHVPLLDPIRLACDHMFCYTCFETYQSSVSGANRNCCPSCRADLPRNNIYARKDVPRMIVNMCNEVNAHCPFSAQGCQMILARELIAFHAGHCDFEPVACPEKSCAKVTRKRDLDSTICRHKFVTCSGCGAEVMDQDLSDHTADCSPSKCCHCGSRQFPGILTLADHEATCLQTPRKCSGKDLGCKVSLKEEGIKTHEESCSFVLLGPYLKFSASKMVTLEANLAVQKDRNERLEATCKRLWDIMKIHIVPTIDKLRHSTDPSQPPSSPSTRTPQPSTTSHYVPTINPNGPDNPPSQFLFPNPLPPTSHHSLSYSPPSNSPDPFTHLLSLHESLRNDVSSMNTRIDGITSSLDNFMAAYTESESRANMMLLNDVLRIKEDLAHTNAALFSLRAQVGWLSRMNGMGVGLTGTRPGRQLGGGGQNVQGLSTASTDSQAQGDTGGPSAVVGGPSMTGAGRPPGVEYGRRSSDGHSSQERVKL